MSEKKLKKKTNMFLLCSSKSTQFVTPPIWLHVKVYSEKPKHIPLTTRLWRPDPMSPWRQCATGPVGGLGSRARVVGTIKFHLLQSCMVTKGRKKFLSLQRSSLNSIQGLS